MFIILYGIIAKLGVYLCVYIYPTSPLNTAYSYHLLVKMKILDSKYF